MASVPGKFEYSPARARCSHRERITLSVIFTPADSANYATAQVAVSLEVAKAMPVIAWPNPDPIPYGALLSTAQLSATASVPGTFDYSPAPGKVLAAGNASALRDLHSH